MGKRQHQQDKLYLTTKEWREDWGGKKDKKGAEFVRLPFFYCFLSMQPFRNPCCLRNGAIFDLVNIVPFINKYKVNPIDGSECSVKDVIKLNFYKNDDGDFHCPILYRVFTESSHIVAVATTGNVYSYDAINELNIKAGNFVDLMDGETKFGKKDLIEIQNPTNLDKFNVQTFFYVKKELNVDDGEKEETMIENLLASSKYEMKNIRKIEADAMNAIVELNEGLENNLQKKHSAIFADKKSDEIIFFKDKNQTAGAVSRSLTSTVMPISTHDEGLKLSFDQAKKKFIKSKAYIRLVTNFGNLNFELHADLVPDLAEHFIHLIKGDVLKNANFDHLIENYYISCSVNTKKVLKPHFHRSLNHAKKGTLSFLPENMNKGNNKFDECITSNFVITLRENLTELNKKCCVVGRLVGGEDTLTTFNGIVTDSVKCRPLQNITILDAIVYLDPFEELIRKRSRKE